MAEHTKYYTLAASLPYLPPIELAEKLPIDANHLKARLNILSEEDMQLLEERLKDQRAKLE